MRGREEIEGERERERFQKKKQEQEKREQEKKKKERGELTVKARASSPELSVGSPVSGYHAV